MSDSLKRTDAEFIRCNMRITKESQSELYEYLSKFTDRARAEESRYLMRLGLMFKNGQLSGGGFIAQPAMQNSPGLINEKTMDNGFNDQSVNTSQQNNVPDEIKPSKPTNPNEISLGDSDLDLGFDLLDL